MNVDRFAAHVDDFVPVRAEQRNQQLEIRTVQDGDVDLTWNRPEPSYAWKRAYGVPDSPDVTRQLR